MNSDIKPLNILIPAQEIDTILTKIAEDIIASHGKKFMLLGILKGGYVCIADLARKLSLLGATPIVELIAVRSYAGTASTGRVHLLLEPSISPVGQKVIIVDEIFETGRTAAFVKDYCLMRGAESANIVALLEKPNMNATQIVPDFVGKQIPDKFVVGYGLDYEGKYRELPDIWQAG